MRYFKYKKEFKIIFFWILSIFSLFWTKSGKKHVFCDFLKNGDFWSKFNINTVFPVKFPF